MRLLYPILWLYKRLRGHCFPRCEWPLDWEWVSYPNGDLGGTCTCRLCGRVRKLGG